MAEQESFESIGPYRIEEEVGSGAMGTVYKAVHETLERSAAIKMLPRDLVSDPEYVARFLREARVIAALRHENVVQVYDAGEHDGKYFIAMEFVDGSTLAKFIEEQGPSDVDSALKVGLELFLQAAKGLAAAHEKGLIHRDIKPDNLLLSSDRKILRIADFGLVSDSSSLTQLTATGTCLGTPQFMSPEMADGDQADERSDLYSLGATFFMVFTGIPPFTSTTVMNLLFKHKFHQVPTPSSVRAGLPENLSNLLMTLLAKQKEERPVSAGKLVELIEKVIAGKEIPPPPVFNSPIPDNSDASMSSVYGRKNEQGSNNVKLAFLVGSILLFVGLAYSILGRGGGPHHVDPGTPTSPNGSGTTSSGGGSSSGSVGNSKVRPWDGKESFAAYAKEVGLANEKTVSLSEDVQIEFVLIAPGSFMMGSQDDEGGRDDTEHAHKVTITRPFYLAKFETTQAQFASVLGEERNLSKWQEQQNPAERVSWHDASEFCQVVSKKQKIWIRLPTEAEWEYACRAGTTTPFSFGSTIDTELANYDGDTIYGDGKPGTDRKHTLQVGLLKPNPWGLYDMHGNVWEWCQDWHASYSQGEVSDPKGPGFGNRRVQRGGSWGSTANDCRSAHRDLDKPVDRSAKYGFRVVLDID